MLLIGIWISEHKPTVLSVFLPLVSVSWAASVVRFDYLIQRQGAYLRVLEADLQQHGITPPLWESWKRSLHSTSVVMPLMDSLGVLVVIATTAYLLFGPARAIFETKGWRGQRLYAWATLILTVALLACLPVIPKIAQW